MKRFGVVRIRMCVDECFLVEQLASQVTRTWTYLMWAKIEKSVAHYISCFLEGGVVDQFRC